MQNYSCFYTSTGGASFPPQLFSMFLLSFWNEHGTPHGVFRGQFSEENRLGTLPSSTPNEMSPANYLGGDLVPLLYFTLPIGFFP